MYVEMINEFHPVNIRQNCNMTIGLCAIKDEHYVDFDAVTQRLVSVDVRIDVAFDPEIDKLVTVRLDNELPVEWSPSLRKRFSREALVLIDRSRTWLAKTRPEHINSQINRPGKITLTGIRRPGKLEPLEILRIEVETLLYHSVANVIFPHPLFKLIEVRK